MSKIAAHRLQEKQLSSGCIGKHRYENQDAAKQKGQTEYHCLFCDGWHRASIKKSAPKTTKNGIAKLPTPKPKAAKTPEAKAQSVASLKSNNGTLKKNNQALQDKNAALGQEIESLKAVIMRRKKETDIWRRRYSRTIEGGLVNLYHAARKRLAQRNVTP
jgi:hypothetical protein